MPVTKAFTLTIYLLILAIICPCLCQFTLPLASEIVYKNFSSRLFALSQDGKKSVFYNQSIINSENAIANGRFLKFWAIDNFIFTNIGYHIYNFGLLSDFNLVFWIGEKVLLLGNTNQYFISDILLDGLTTQQKTKNVAAIQWYLESFRKIGYKQNYTFCVLNSAKKSQKYYPSKVYYMAFIQEQLLVTHVCLLSKTYSISDCFHSVFLLQDYYCVAVVQGTNNLTIQCCSSQANTSIVTTFSNMTTFSSKFRIAPISGTYDAYLIYQNAYIQKIKFNPIDKAFTLKPFSWKINKYVEGAAVVNGKLISIQNVISENLLVVSFYYENNNAIQAFQRLISFNYLAENNSSLAIDDIHFQIFPNNTAIIFSKLPRLQSALNFLIRFIQTKQIKEDLVGITMVLIFLSIFMTLSVCYCIRNLTLTRMKLIMSINMSQALIELICYAVAFIAIYLKVIATDTNQVNYNQQQNLGAQTLSGSFWLRLLEKAFVFLSIVITNSQLKQMHKYINHYIQNHIRHGFKVNFYISLALSKLFLKTILISAAAFLLLFKLQQNYNILLKTFQLNFNIVRSFVVFTITLISFTLFGKLICWITNSYWKTLSILYLLVFGLSYWSDLFYHYFLTIFWLPSLFKSYIQLIYRAQFRFIYPLISQLQMELIMLTHFVILLILYIGRMKWIQRKNSIDRMILKKQKKQLNSNMNFSGSDQEFFKTNIQIQSEDSLLNVYIPIKMNLKYGLQKNKVLEDINFAGKKGQVLSFIDEKHQSKNALFKILTGQEKSHEIIELGLVGKVSYSQKVAVSYCRDYDLSFPELTVYEHLEFYYWLKKPSSTKQQMKSQIQHILDEFQISDDFRVKKARQLSGGYLKKMSLACAFVGDPDVIIIDQPTLGLDIKFQKLFQYKIKAWKQNKLIIIFTANHNEAYALSDKIWYFQNQRILRYQQIKQKYQQIQIKLQFLTQNAFNQIYPITQKFCKETCSKTSLITTKQIAKLHITIDRPHKEGVNNQIQQFIKVISQKNQPIYKCHFDYRMIQKSLNHLELLDKYSDPQSFCNKCDGRRLYQQLKSEENINNYFQGISVGEDSRTREMNKAQQLLSMFSQEADRKILWTSQVMAMIYRRHELNNNMKSEKGSIFYSQLSFWFSWLAMFIQQDLHLINKVISYFVLYLILHMQTVHFYVTQKELGHYDYYKSIGIGWMYYWAGNILYDFLYLLLPLIGAILLSYSLQSFGFLSYFQTSFYSLVSICVLLALSYSLLQACISLFLSSADSKHSLLFTILLFPFLLEFDPYFANYNSQELGFGYLSYLLFPWSLNTILQSNQNEALYYLIVALQIFLMIIFIFIIEKGREFHRQKEGRFYIQDFDHSNNEQTLSARREIEEIVQKKQYVLGEDISKCYGQKVSLRNISFYVKKGEILGVFGHNSSGKTTLFKVIVRRLSQSSGFIHYFGKRRKQLNLLNSIQLSYCPQFDHFDPDLSLEQNLITIGKIKGIQTKYLSRLIAAFLGYMDLKGNQQVLVRDLSVGERKKAYFIAVFLGFPKLIVCDQISAGVDNHSCQKIMALLKAYSSSHKKCVILTSHNINEGQEFCDRIMLLKNGVLKASSSAFRLRMDASQQLYKIIITLKRQDNPILRNRSKKRIVQLFKEVEFKKNVFEDDYSMVYSVDMKERIGFIFAEIYNIYLQGMIAKFSFYKHDLEEFAKTYMSQKQEDSIQ